MEIRKTAKAANVQPLRVGVATLLAIELAKILGPPGRPSRRGAKAEVMTDHLNLGVGLLKLKAAEPARFGALAYKKFKVNPKSAIVYRTIAAAKLYAQRPEITSRISWDALSALSAPSLPPAVRRKLEAAIMSGQAVRAPHIRRARQAHARQRRADQPALRMAA